MCENVNDLQISGRTDGTVAVPGTLSESPSSLLLSSYPQQLSCISGDCTRSAALKAIYWSLISNLLLDDL